MNSRISTELSTLAPSLCLKIFPLAPPHSDSLFMLSELHSCFFLFQTWSKTIHLFFGLCISFCSLFSLSPYISLASPWPQPGGPLCSLKGNRIFRNDPLKSLGWFTDVSVKETHKVQDCISPHKTKGVHYSEDLCKKGEKRRPWAWLTCFNVTERRGDQFRPTHKGTYTNTYFQEEQKPCLRHLFISLLSLKLWNMWLSWGAVTLPNAWIYKFSCAL